VQETIFSFGREHILNFQNNIQKSCKKKREEERKTGKKKKDDDKTVF